ncbi:MAG TPA: cob(I)yrinic acid a,c-diamide adenosyltransferase [Lachnospiraceae bacterium]|nr:cob(I)yrinic acid a,c-diamide adenosyltransferase [Lachnospiraceae bacterium]
MNSMLTTKSGDGGMTTLNGSRLMKDDPRIEFFGAGDELTSWLGLLKAETQSEHFRACLSGIQENLIRIMAGASRSAEGERYPGRNQLSGDETAKLEEEMDRILASFRLEMKFILPGKSAFSAKIDIARTVARRAERAYVSLTRVMRADPDTERYLNRLSDYLYAAARCVDAGKEVNL